MNIFVLDKDPVRAATLIDDKRLIKLTLESAQIMGEALIINGMSRDVVPYHSYRHRNHPVVKWTADSEGNYLWLYKHFLAQNEEYVKRFPDKGRYHKCYEFHQYYYQNSCKIKPGKLIKFSNCAARKDLGISFKHIEDPVEAYRLYLVARWKLDKYPPRICRKFIDNYKFD